MDPHNLEAAHSVEEYKRALLACRSLLRGKKYLDMLKANYNAPEHKITAGEMAAAVGYANWSAANVQYGAYAGAIAEALGHTRRALKGVGVDITLDIAILVSFDGSVDTGENVAWQLLPAVVQALEELNWVR
jgi:hypothetical protein